MRGVVLDAMGVLFAAADDVAELLVPFVRAAGGNASAVETAYLHASLGAIDPDTFWSRVGLDPSVEDEYLSRHALMPGAAEFLQQAKAADIPVWCLSNDIARWSTKLRVSHGIEQLLSGAVISSDVGSRKPDPPIYRRLLDRAGCRPAELMFVDDRARNVEAAAVLGIPSMCFTKTYGFAALASDVARWAAPPTKR